MKTTEKRGKIFMMGMFSVLLAFGMVLAGCQTVSKGGDTSVKQNAVLLDVEDRNNVVFSFIDADHVYIVNFWRGVQYSFNSEYERVAGESIEGSIEGTWVHSNNSKSYIEEHGGTKAESLGKPYTISNGKQWYVEGCIIDGTTIKSYFTGNETPFEYNYTLKDVSNNQEKYPKNAEGGIDFPLLIDVSFDKFTGPYPSTTITESDWITAWNAANSDNKYDGGADSWSSIFDGKYRYAKYQNENNGTWVYYKTQFNLVPQTQLKEIVDKLFFGYELTEKWFNNRPLGYTETNFWFNIGEERWGVFPHGNYVELINSTTGVNSYVCLK